MCGRYVTSRGDSELARLFDVDQLEIPDTRAPDYNVAPTRDVPAVVQRAAGPEEPAVRTLCLLRWGLVPSWAGDPAIGSRLINARVETAATKPAYRRAFQRRRCLLPADGYYEWTAGGPEAGGRTTRRPFFIHPEQGVLALAGLYERWRDPGRDPDDPRSWLWSTTILTRPADPSVTHLHHRMPLLVPAERFAEWLDPSRPAACAQELATTPPPVPLVTRPVSTAVNNVRNNGPQLTDRVPDQPVQTALSLGD
jgi:putative SOS response-associated peptidase YedK